jgi:hypothetical protein
VASLHLLRLWSKEHPLSLRRFNVFLLRASIHDGSSTRPRRFQIARFRSLWCVLASCSMASAVAPWALKRAEAIGSRRFDGVGQRLRGGVTSLDFGRRGHRLGAHSGAVAAHCAAVEARDGTVSRAARGASWSAVEVIRRSLVEAEPSGPRHPSECPGLRLLEEDIQHVRLNVVWVGTDGRCAELERDVQ